MKDQTKKSEINKPTGKKRLLQRGAQKGGGWKKGKNECGRVIKKKKKRKQKHTTIQKQKTKTQSTRTKKNNEKHKTT